MDEPLATGGYLLSLGADPNLVTTQEETARPAAADAKFPRMIKFLEAVLSQPRFASTAGEISVNGIRGTTDFFVASILWLASWHPFSSYGRSLKGIMTDQFTSLSPRALKEIIEKLDEGLAHFEQRKTRLPAAEIKIQKMMKELRARLAERLASRPE